jgi:hypothetical protein
MDSNAVHNLIILYVAHHPIERESHFRSPITNIAMNQFHFFGGRGLTSAFYGWSSLNKNFLIIVEHFLLR